MNPLQIPTDNLYKFLALTGAVLAIFAHIFPILEIDKLKNEYIQLAAQSKIILIETNAIGDEIDENNDKIKSYKYKSETNIASIKLIRDEMENGKISKLKFLEYIDIKEKEIDNISTLISEKNYEIKRKETQLEIKKEEFKKKQKEIKVLSEAIDRLLSYTVHLFFIGILMSAIGFYFWHTRIQSHIDKNIKKMG